MNRKVPISVDEYYHLYNRGVDKRRIFSSNADYQRFIALLYLCNSKKPVDVRNTIREGRTFASVFEEDRGQPIVALGAWCLMPNHFHLLCKEIDEGGTALFMQKLCTAYSMYFNRKIGRSGSLFEGKFKSQHVDTDEYLRYMYAYIYLNPVKLVEGEHKWKEHGIRDLKKVSSFLSAYDSSSMPKALRNDPYAKILEEKEFPGYFESTASMERDVLSWLKQ
jgi:REP element-mobilizing transposase RayT